MSLLSHLDVWSLSALAYMLFWALFFLWTSGFFGGREWTRVGGERAWMTACRETGLTGLSLERHGVKGRRGRFPVTLARSVHPIGKSLVGQAGPGIEITVEGAAIPLLALRSEFYRLRKAGQVPAVDVQVGDPGFDTRFAVSGSRAHALALLDAGTRSLLMKMDAQGGFDVSDGQVTAYVEGESKAVLQAALSTTLELVDRLTAPLDVPASLAERATRDPAAGVRREALRALARGWAGHPSLRPTALAATSDPDVEVRLAAAAALGEEGLPVAFAVLDDATSHDATVASALAVLDRRLPAARAAELLNDARDRRRLDTARACIGRLGQGPAEDTLGPLAEVLRIDGGELAASAARALGKLGTPAAESALIAALGRDVPGLRPDAAEALGRVGTVAAVLRLKEAAERYAGEGDFPHIARQAVAAIQSRAAGADRGQLTIADDSTGRVSLAERAEGQLSVPEGEPGRLSIPVPRVRQG
jgi:HEAT repeat protein